jgi:hypothetical protein
VSAPETVPRLALTITEAATATGYSDDVIRAALGRGELVPRYGTKSKPVIPVTELQRWLDSLPTERWAS